MLKKSNSMESLRILLLSGSRPSRTWKIADRIKRELPEVEISGIIQQVLPLLPLTQQLIASGSSAQGLPSDSVNIRMSHWLHDVLEGLLHWLIWFIHGCPRGLNAVQKFTTEHLAEKCQQAGCPYLLMQKADDTGVLDFIQRHADLVIVLGDVELSRELLLLPELGVLCVCTANDPPGSKERLQIQLEYFAQGEEAARTIASVALP